MAPMQSSARARMLPAAGPRWVIAVIAGYFCVASTVIYFGITISRLRGLEEWELD